MRNKPFIGDCSIEVRKEPGQGGDCSSILTKVAVLGDCSSILRKVATVVYGRSLGLCSRSRKPAYTGLRLV